MKVLLVSSEYEGLIKVGGLSDFVRALAHALKRRGHDVRVLIPYYRQLKTQIDHSLATFPIDVRLSVWRSYRCAVHRHMDGQIPVYLLERNDCFDRSGIYDNQRGAYADNPLRFALLAHAAFELSLALNWPPDVMHASDWQSSMLCFYRKEHFGFDPFFRFTRTVLTIHNGAYQGRHDAVWHEPMGIHPKFMVSSLFEDMGCLNIIKAGICLADRVVTVSPSYRDELLERDTSHGLSDIFGKRRGNFIGVLNGVDEQTWSPEVDPFIPQRYSVERLSGKAVCRNALIGKLGLSGWQALAPIFAYIGRVVEQKGISILLPAIRAYLQSTGAVHKATFVVMGHSEPRFQAELKTLSEQFPDHFFYQQEMAEQDSRHLLSGADFLLMPSLFEPCGLSQLYAMRYGTVPLVNAVGGLRDTVIPLDSGATNRSSATGYAIYTPSALLLEQLIDRAANDFSQAAGLYAMLQRNGMRLRFSWNDAARQYERLYKSVMPSHNQPLRQAG